MNDDTDDANYLPSPAEIEAGAAAIKATGDPCQRAESKRLKRGVNVEVIAQARIALAERLARQRERLAGSR